MMGRFSNTLPNALAGALQLIATMVAFLLARLKPETGAPPAAPALDAPARSAHWRGDIEWPRIGGAKFTTPPKDIFLGAEYAVRYRPGIARTVYVACCSGLKHVATQSRIPLAKVSSCGDGRLLDRTGELRSDAYGSIVVRDGERVDEPGWDDWFAIKLSPKFGPAPNSPVVVAERGLVVRLPANMTADQFDSAFDELVLHGAFAPWLDTPDGRRHSERVSFERVAAWRFTRYAFDSAARLSAASEIAVFRRNTDHDRLIAIVEYVVLRHLGLLR